MRRLLITSLVLIGACAITRGQNSGGNDCEGTLGLATQEYEAGHFYGIDSLLANCIRNGFSREQRQRAFLMMTHVHLLLDEPEKAKQSYLELLKANPEFETDPARDPIEVVYLSKKFTAAPVFSVYGRLGGNLSFINVIETPSITGEPISTKYVLKPGWNAAVGGEFHVRNPFSIGAEIQFASTAFRREQQGLWETSSTTEMEDKQTWLQIPVFAKYTHTNPGKIKPYAYAGLSLNVILSDNGSSSLFFRKEQGGQTVTPNESPIQSFGFKRNAFSKSFFMGAGLQYKWNLDYLFGEVRYAVGMENLFNYTYLDYSKAQSYNGTADYTQTNLLDTGAAAFENAAQDDFFRLSNLYVAVGFRHPLYKPRELKKARTARVLNEIKKQEDGEK